MTIDEVWMCHTLEHIQKKSWPSVLFEVSRVLKIGGTFYLTYPEFTKCVDLWEDNYRGQKEYYEACIFGRQCNIWDTHVSLCHTPDIIHMCKMYGFDGFVHSEENEPQYSALKMTKVSEIKTKEDLILDMVFRGN